MTILESRFEDFLRTILAKEVEPVDHWDNGTDEFHYYDCNLYGEQVTIKFIVSMKDDSNFEAYKKEVNGHIWETI